MLSDILFSTGSGNGLAPNRRQAITGTNAGSLITGQFGPNLSEIRIKIQNGSFKKNVFVNVIDKMSIWWWWWWRGGGGGGGGIWKPKQPLMKLLLYNRTVFTSAKPNGVNHPLSLASLAAAQTIAAVASFNVEALQTGQ